MKIKFLASKNKEVERLINLYEDYKWFIDNAFPIILPKFFKSHYRKFGVKKYNKKLLKNIFQNNIKLIYSQKKYEKIINDIKKEWLKVEEDFWDALERLGFKSKKAFLCYISLYGPGGQFKYPNSITIRAVNKMDLKEANTNIAHEIMHLLLYKKFEKLNLKYAQIEGIVDLFFIKTEIKNIFPNYKKQTIAKHNEKLFERIINLHNPKKTHKWRHYFS